MEWKWAIVAIDRIRGLSAEVALVPRQLRSDAEIRSRWPSAEPAVSQHVGSTRAGVPTS